ncbi:MAG: hypothetical protein ACR2GT_02325 [Gaiellaceae bacterium]
MNTRAPEPRGPRRGLWGKVAEALMAKADDLFATPPDIQKADA